MQRKTIKILYISFGVVIASTITLSIYHHYLYHFFFNTHDVTINAPSYCNQLKMSSYETLENIYSNEQIKEMAYICYSHDCNFPFPNFGNEQDFDFFIDQFVRDAKKYGNIDVSYILNPDNINQLKQYDNYFGQIKWGEQKENSECLTYPTKTSECIYGYANLSFYFGEITLSKTYWKKISPKHRRQLLYHELSHSVLNLHECTKDVDLSCKFKYESCIRWGKAIKTLFTIGSEKFTTQRPDLKLSQLETHHKK